MSRELSAHHKRMEYITMFIQYHSVCRVMRELDMTVEDENYMNMYTWGKLHPNSSMYKLILKCRTKKFLDGLNGIISNPR